MKWAVAHLLILIWGVGFGLWATGGYHYRGVRAANPPAVDGTQQNPDLFSYQGVSLQNYSKDNANLKATGIWTWRFADVQGCPSESIHGQVSAALSEAVRFGTTVVEQPNSSAAHIVYGSCGSEFQSVCGGPPVIGCLGRGFPYDNTVEISTDMADYYDVSQRAIALHEVIGHAMADWNEQYVLGGSFGASNDVTIMNTGPLSRHDLGVKEDEREWRTMGSPELKTFGRGANASGEYTYACNFDSNATRISILYSDNGQGLYWSGVILQLAPDRNGCQGIGAVEGVVVVPGRCVYWKQENAASWRVSFNETRVACY